MTALAVGDLDRDGLDDVVATLSSGGLASWTHDGGELAPRDVAITGGWPDSVALADFAGDGCLSAATANATDGSVSFLRGEGDGTFAAPLGFGVGVDARAVVAAQLDGEGPLDLAVLASGEAPGEVHVFFGGAP